MPFGIYKKFGVKKEKVLFDKPLIFFDIETTGLDPRNHEIIEIACLVVDPKSLEVKKKYHSRVRPEHIETADPGALRLNGYNAEGWRDAKGADEALEDLNKLASGGILAGYNVVFDHGFLEKAAWDHEVLLTFDYHWLDVASMAYWELAGGDILEKLSLSGVCKLLGIERGKAHTAMADTRATLEVYKALKSMKQKGQ